MTIVTCVLIATCTGGLVDEIAAADRRADAAVAAIRTPAELTAKQGEWRAAWQDGIGGLPETRTPLNAKAGPVVTCDGFTLQNVLFESQPGVYVVGHLFLPDAVKFAPPYPCVMMLMGHSDNGILNLRYATHAAMTARAGLAVFSWNPIGQGEPIVLKAKGWDCIAAAHAFAAEPQLFSGIEFTERPPSWTEMVVTPDTKDDSFAVGVWGALLDYDWVDLVK